MPVTQMITTVGRTSGPSYTLTPFFSGGPQSVNEGSGLNFLVGGAGIPDGTYYWTIETNAGDFATASGTVTVTSNYGVFGVTPTADTTTEGSESFTVALREGSITGTILVTSQSVTINDTSLTPEPVPPFSLEFVQNEGDYLDVAGSSDFNLATTWTIEFWLKANASSDTAGGGIWGLLNQVGWSTTNAIVVALSDNKLVFLSVADSANNDVRYVEPTPGVWTHVAIANDAGTQKVFYNGAEQARVSGNVGTASYTNGSSPLRIGRLGPTNGGTLNGKMALVRISNTVKYSTAFTPVTTYGVEADTKLFLGTNNPLVDSVTPARAITNNGVTLSNDVPGAFAPLSLQLVQSQTDYLDVAASSDWALGTTWTIEFWSKAAKASTEGDLLTVMCQNYNVGGSIDLMYIGGELQFNGTRLVGEPTPNNWTHVALVSDGTNLVRYTSGFITASMGAVGLNNTTDAIRVGARGPADFQRFDGKLALIRISNAAKYTGTFTPTTTYGVEADTVLFLGTAAPLIDAKGHITTNNGVTTSTDVPT